MDCQVWRREGVGREGEDANHKGESLAGMGCGAIVRIGLGRSLDAR